MSLTCCQSSQVKGRCKSMFKTVKKYDTNNSYLQHLWKYFHRSNVPSMVGNPEQCNCFGPQCFRFDETDCRQHCKVLNFVRLHLWLGEFHSGCWRMPTQTGMNVVYHNGPTKAAAKAGDRQVSECHCLKHGPVQFTLRGFRDFNFDNQAPNACMLDFLQEKSRRGVLIIYYWWLYCQEMTVSKPCKSKSWASGLLSFLLWHVAADDFTQSQFYDASTQKLLHETTRNRQGFKTELGLWPCGFFWRY